MTDMIEKVARAIQRSVADGLKESGLFTPDEADAHAESWEAIIPEARAAIAALREPDAELLIEGASAPPAGAKTDTMHGRTLIIKAAWKAMIDAILAERDREEK